MTCTPDNPCRGCNECSRPVNKGVVWHDRDMHELKIIAQFEISELEVESVVKNILFSSGKGRFIIKEVRVRALQT